MTNEIENTKRLAHYVIARANPNKLGAVKLNKILWFADLEFYRLYGESMTGATSYVKRQHGPVPNHILRSIETLEVERKVSRRVSRTAAGTRHEFVWLLEPDLRMFSARELDVLNQVIGWICDEHTANSISNLTHDALWDEIDIGGKIPLGAASIQPGEVTEQDIEWAVSALESIN